MARWFAVRRGFTLHELLAAALLAATVSAVTLQAARQVLSFSERLSRRTLAWERGQAVLSILDPRVTHAAFGLTYERAGSVFQRSFGGGSIDYPLPGQWSSNQGPLYIMNSGLVPVAETGGVCQGPALGVLYAVPSGQVAKLDGNEPLSLSAGSKKKVKLLPRESLSAIAERIPTTAQKDLRAWVVFPLTGYPLYVSAYAVGELTMELAKNSGLSAALRPYDEMHYLRGNRFQVPLNSASLQSEELHASWTNKEFRVDGVLEMWFRWTSSKKLLEAWILTTGGISSSGKKPRPENWPEAAPWTNEFSRHDAMVARGSWILRNL